MPRRNGPGAVELLNEQHAREGVREGEVGEAQAFVRCLAESGVKPVGAADEQRHVAACALLLLALSMAVFFYEHAKKCVARWFDLLLMTATGLAGCILALMLFSEHPTTSTNLQVLLLNPLPLFFLWPVARGRRTRFFAIQMVLILLFFLGGVWQSYAEGTYVTALCLLTRDARHCFFAPKK